MPSFTQLDDEELKFYTRTAAKGPDTIYISDNQLFVVPWSADVRARRSIRKRIGGDEDVEIVRAKGEYLLSSTPKGYKQVKVIVFENDGRRKNFVLQKFQGPKSKPTSGQSISFDSNEFEELLEFLETVEFIDLSNLKAHRQSSSGIAKQVLVTQDDKNFLASIRNMNGEERRLLLQQIHDEKLSRDELDILLGRRVGLDAFYKNLYVENDWKEKQWQKFFEDNIWIFGYGLDYRFQSILQREAAVSDVDLDHKQTVTTDFLTASTAFTVVVEVKCPTTPIFRGDKTQRSKAWGLSLELFDAVSQILAQKAEWQSKSERSNYDGDGNAIAQKTVDPKCILIIGSNSDVTGSDRDRDTKSKTFELFRRDSRNIEILTYDELYERAFFIVNQRLPDKPTLRITDQ